MGIFYDRFVALAREKGLSPTAAALKMGFSNATPSKWREGPPNHPNLQKIAAFFGVDEAYLLGHTGELHGSRRITLQIEGTSRSIDYIPQTTELCEYTAVMCEKGLFSHLVPSGIMILASNKKATDKPVAIRSANNRVFVARIVDLNGLEVVIGPDGEVMLAEEAEILGEVVEVRLTP